MRRHGAKRTDSPHPVGRWQLSVLGAAQFVLILDVAVVNVALVPLTSKLTRAGSSSSPPATRRRSVACCWSAAGSPTGSDAVGPWPRVRRWSRWRRLPAEGSYLIDELPGMVLVAAGMGAGFAVGSIAATTGVPAQRQGAASALLSTSTQAGAAIGLILLGVIAASSTNVTNAASAAFTAMAVISAVAALASATLTIRLNGGAALPPAVPAQASGCLPGCVASRIPTIPTQEQT